MLVPSRGAAESLRRTLETLQLTAASPALLLPDLIAPAVGKLSETLHERLPGVAPMLTDFEREVIFEEGGARCG